MNVVEDDMSGCAEDPRVLAEAEDWFARLRTSNCPPGERARFERWRAEPAHAAAYARTERLWRGIGGLSEHAELRRMAAEALAATDPRRARRRRVPLALAASLAACLVLLGGWLWLRPSAPVVHATAPGQRDTVVLEDGSRLLLNGDSAVAVRYGRRGRDLVLERGEALFEVAHDAGRPFRVQAGDGEVTALGTRFQVRRQPARVTVTLLEGRVAVARPDTRARLTLAPGEQAVLADGAPIATRRVDAEAASSWTRGRLLFRAAPLAEVVEEVNRYAARPLRLADPTLGATPVSGTFPIGDSPSVALALQALLPVRADLSGPDGIVLSRR